MNTTEIGDKSEAIVLAELVKNDYEVLLPFGNGRRYDFIIGSSIGYRKVQVKTGRIEKGCVVFNTANRKGNYRDIDLFAVYCPTNEETYLVPSGNVGVSHGYLRLEPTKNGQTKSILWAKDFKVLKQ